MSHWCWSPSAKSFFDFVTSKSHPHLWDWTRSCLAFHWPLRWYFKTAESLKLKLLFPRRQNRQFEIRCCTYFSHNVHCAQTQWLTWSKFYYIRIHSLETSQPCQNFVFLEYISIYIYILYVSAQCLEADTFSNLL